jgi:hypothetical protein
VFFVCLRSFICAAKDEAEGCNDAQAGLGRQAAIESSEDV